MANEFIIKNGFHSKGNSEVTGSLEVSGSNLNADVVSGLRKYSSGTSVYTDTENPGGSSKSAVNTSNSATLGFGQDQILGKVNALDGGGSITQFSYLSLTPSATQLLYRGPGESSDSGLILNPSGFTFTDTTSTPNGLKYNADYSATYVSRSLVDQEYVVDYVAASASADNISNANLTFDGAHTTNFNSNKYTQTFNSADQDARIEYYHTGAINAVDYYDIYGTLNFGIGRQQTGLLNGSIWSRLKIEVGLGTEINAGNETGYMLFKDNYKSYSQIGKRKPHFFLAGNSFDLSTHKFVVGHGGVVGAEHISLKSDTLVKGSDNSASTSGFKVTDVNNVSLLDIKNNGKLELSTTADGFLMPRLTTTQKNAISSPDTNLMLFDTTLNTFQRYNGSAWVDVAGGGNNISNANLTFDGSYYADLNDNSWQLKDSTGANRLLLDVQQGNANGHGIGYGGAAVDGKHTFYNTATNGTQALGQMSFLNGLKLSNGSLEQDYLNFGSGGFLLHIKSHVSYGSSIGVYPDITLRTRHSSTGIVLDTNNFTSFKKNTVAHSIIDSSSRWILKGSAVIGSEKISLQDDTLVKGSDNAEATSGFKVTDVNDDITFDIRNNGQIGYGGAKDNLYAHKFRNPNNEARIASFDDGVAGVESFIVQTNGRFYSEQFGQTVFLSYRQAGQSWIKLYDAGVESIRLGKLGSFINGALRVGGASGTTTGTTGARFEIGQQNTNTYQQLFFANARVVTLGRINSSGAFGTDQKGLECYDTDLNKKFFWNGTAWEQIVSGGATSGEGTKVLVKGAMGANQTATSTISVVELVDSGTPAGGALDVNGEFDNSTHRFTVGASGDGTYNIQAQLFLNNGSSWSTLYLYKNGSVYSSFAGFGTASTSWDNLDGTISIDLVVGDYIDIRIFSSGNGTIDFNNWADRQSFSITKIGDSVTVNNVTAQTLNKTFTLESPTASDDVTVFRTDVAITVQEVIACSVGSSPSTTYQLKHHTDRSNVGNALTTSAATTSTTTGDVASLSDATIPANSWIWFESTAASGTDVYLSIDVRYTED